MKPSQFKLLATLPEGFDYEIMTFNGHKAVVGKNGQSIIGFFIREDKLVPIDFMLIN